MSLCWIKHNINVYHLIVAILDHILYNVEKLQKSFIQCLLPTQQRIPVKRQSNLICGHFSIRPKKKIIVWDFPTDPSSKPPTLNFFSTFKRKFKLREEKWQKKNYQNPLNSSKVTSYCRNRFVTFAGSLFY